MEGMKEERAEKGSLFYIISKRTLYFDNIGKQ